MGQNKDSRISIANLLALIGLAGIAVVVFFGFLLKSSDGLLTNPLLFTIAIVAALGLFLMFSIKAKKADNNPDKWRYVEWVALLLYLGVACVSAPAFTHFFGVMGNKQKLIEQAKQEIKAIEDIYDDYDNQRKVALANAVEMLTDYNDSKQKDTAIEAYKKKHINNIEGWNSNSEANTVIKDNGLADIKSGIENWKLLELSALSSKLALKEAKVKTDIENFIAQYGEENELIPVIDHVHGKYQYTGLKKFDIKEGPEPEFYKALHKKAGSSPVGWIVLVVLHLLVLLSYLTARRANYVRPKAGSHAGGIELRR